MSQEPSHPFLSGLAASLECTGLRQPPLLVAVSGGPDSVALLCGLHHLSSELGLALTVIHFNHRYRGDASDGDAAWVARLADRFGLPFLSGVATHTGATLREESARDDRYEFFQTAALQSGVSTVATGHTRDDQVETVMHHLLRGTGLAGLRGMPNRRSHGQLEIVRPLLQVSRSLVMEYLADIGQDFREDATNLDQRLTRNWLRHAALPPLRDRFPLLDDAIIRLTAQAGELSEFTESQAEALLTRATIAKDATTVTLTNAELATAPRALLRALFVLLWKRQQWPRQLMTFAHWESLAQLVATPRGRCQFPGRIDAVRHRAALTLTRQQSLPSAETDR